MPPKLDAPGPDAAAGEGEQPPPTPTTPAGDQDPIRHLKHQFAGSRSAFTRQVNAIADRIKSCRLDQTYLTTPEIDRLQRKVTDRDDEVTECCDKILRIQGGDPPADNPWLQAIQKQRMELRDALRQIVELRRMIPQPAAPAPATPAASAQSRTATPQARIVSSLKPEKLTQEYTMRAYAKWCLDLHNFFSASLLLAAPADMQRAHLSSCVDDVIGVELHAKCPMDTPIFGKDESCISVLTAMFKTQHPVNSRRHTLFSHILPPGRSLTEFRRHNKELLQMAIDADIPEEGLTREQIVLFLSLLSAPDKRTREKLTEIENLT